MARTQHALTFKDPLLPLEQALRARVVQARFGRVLPAAPPRVWELSLYPFTTHRPLRFLRDDAAVELRDFLLSDPIRSIDALEVLRKEITHAVATLVSPSPSWTQEGDSGSWKPHDLVRFDHMWHPEYQRYSEHALNHLINLPLTVMGRQAGKNYVAQALSNRVSLLRDMGHGGWTEGLSSAVRNAISHGNTSFQLNTIHYGDRRAPTTMAQSEFFRLFDALVETCHSLIVGILLFLATLGSSGSQISVSRLPLGILHLILTGYGTNRFFSIGRLLESETVDGRRQLNLACATPFPSRTFHALEAFHICECLLDLGATRFERLGFSIECRRRISAAVFLSLPMIMEIREGKRPVSDMKKAIEGDMLWHEIGRVSQKMLGWRMALVIAWEEMKEQVVANWRKAGFKTAGSLYELRDIRSTTSGLHRRLEVIAVLRPSAPFDRPSIRAVARHAISRARRHMVAAESFGEPRWPRWFPLQVWLRLYADDRPLRHLRSPGRPAPGLLLHAEWLSPWRRAAPVLVTKPDETWKGLRIQYFSEAQP